MCPARPACLVATTAEQVDGAARCSIRLSYAERLPRGTVLRASSLKKPSGNSGTLFGFQFCGPQAEEVARRSSENIQAVTQASTVLARGVQEASQEVFGLVQDRVQKNVEAMSRIAGSRSVQDFVAVQSDLARDGLQQVIDTNKRVAEVSLRIADEAGRIIQDQADQNAKQVRRVA